jgi:hypothetical protein
MAGKPKDHTKSKWISAIAISIFLAFQSTFLGGLFALALFMLSFIGSTHLLRILSVTIACVFFLIDILKILIYFAKYYVGQLRIKK